MNACLAQLSDLVRQEAGIELPAHRHGALHAALSRVAPGLDPCAFLRAATGSQPGGRDLVDGLIDEVTVQESSFLRDPAQFRTIDWRRVHAACQAAGADRVRVWSSGCAHGEEAYTLALLAAEAFAPDPAPVSVLGTDISARALDAASAGRFGRRAIRAVSAEDRQRYFKQQDDGTYVVGDRLRAMVRFGRHNLARDPFPPAGESAFDVIACRNVLIYLGAPVAARVIDGLEMALRPGGMLLLGAADALFLTTKASRRPPKKAAHGALSQPAHPAPHKTARKAPGSAPVPSPRAPARADSTPRRPLGRVATASREDRLAAVLDAANQGRRDQARAHVTALLTENPMDAQVQFVHGLIALEAGDAQAATAALRRALYADSKFALAAFTLGRAYDALGDAAAARRSYRHALRHLDPDDQRHDVLLKHVDIGDIAAACRTRLAGGQQ